MASAAPLSTLVPRLAGVRVLVVGDAMLDHYVVGTVDRISPEAPVPILRVEREFDRPGGAANVAVNIAALGGKAELVCLVGRDRSDERDPDAERLSRLCRPHGIEPTLLRFLPCTIRKTRILAGQQQLLRVDRESPFGRTAAEHEAAAAGGAPWEPLPLSASEATGRASALAPLLARCDAVLVSDYAKGMVDAALMAQLRASGRPVVVDPRPQHTALYEGASLVTPNRKEAGEMLGLDPRRPLSGEELGRRLAARLGGDVLVTLGAEGMCLVPRDGDAETIPTRAREVFDVTGAGDTVAAVVALALGAGLPLGSAAHLANAAAGRVVAHIGTATVTAAELRDALERE